MRQKSNMLKTAMVIVSLCLAACASPNTGGTPVSQPVVDEKENPAAVTVEGQIAPENLTRVQFVKALECAKIKSDDESLNAGFDSQLDVFGSSTTDANFQSIMAAGGGGPYLLYKEAAKLGCNGQ